MAVEVLSISPPGPEVGLRDVFAGRTSMGDESDWVDEDDDATIFVGGLGQTGSTSGPQGPSRMSESMPTPSKPMTLLIPVKSQRSKGKRAIQTLSSPVGRTLLGPIGGDKTKKSPPLEVTEESRMLSRRQLPHGRSGPAFQENPIQEEDEEEEEEEEVEGQDVEDDDDAIEKDAIQDVCEIANISNHEI